MKQFLLAALILSAISTIGCATGPGGYYGYGGRRSTGYQYQQGYRNSPGPGYVWRGGRWVKSSRARSNRDRDYDDRRDGNYRDRDGRYWR